ncbi:hypoxanthine phosphoribosyltransferase [Acidaminobacter sp.]|uniref:hypoxanthine phosphoribosyltransferase n=1 Tax=Acidaminobacter sp. TaxID=1872102 RepID=UPI00137D0D13|nr:hypoxanthine phosphoribosyltransferase [Acidaminobacter sp.]MDK9709689.1 hypoxanthine phosphoribosyltransferase [Acidaminobacter sp.]MZQ96954.1 hypoxanthine phosphoribosyltransferase [Acidaminobacter sp.]
MNHDIKEILISQEALAARVQELGQEISEKYKGKELLMIGVLKGANVFMSDLMRAVSVPIQIDFIAASSYGSSTESSGVVRIVKDLDYSIEGKHVMIVEDIIDTGLTLKYLYDNFSARKPSSLSIISLLDKPERRKADIKVDYTGFIIPDEFIVGYGIDYAEKYRNLPFVATLKPEVYSK